MSDFSDEAREVSENQGGQGPSTGTSSAAPRQEAVSPGAPPEEVLSGAAPAMSDVAPQVAEERGENAFSPPAEQNAEGASHAAPGDRADGGATPTTTAGPGESTGATMTPPPQQTDGQAPPTYGQVGYAAYPPRGAVRMESVPVPMGTTAQPLGKRRNPFAVLVLSFITFGIYFLYWYGTINSEIRRHDPRIRVSPALAVLAQFVPIANLVSGYNTAERVKRLEMADRMPSQISPVLSVLLMIFFGIGYPIQIQSHLNAQWDHHTLGLSTG